MYLALFAKHVYFREIVLNETIGAAGITRWRCYYVSVPHLSKRSHDKHQPTHQPGRNEDHHLMSYIVRHRLPPVAGLKHETNEFQFISIKPIKLR